MADLHAEIRWTTEDVAAFLRAYGRIPQTLEVEQLESWWFNVVLRLEADGERLVLRRYGVTPFEEVRWELAVLDHLRGHGFPTIAPLTRRDAQEDPLGVFLGKPAILYPFVEGSRGCELEWSLAVSQTAEAIARLHNLTEGLLGPYPRIRSGAEPGRMWRGLQDLVARRGVAAHEAALAELLTRADRALRAFEMSIEARAAGLRRGVVHNDAHCDNVLFQDGRLVALIDFDDAYEGYLIADVASMIARWAADWSTSDELDLDRAMVVVREYERHRRLTETERQLLPDFLLVFLLSDAAEYVRGKLARRSDGNVAVNDCQVYRGYLRLADHAEWLASFRHELARI